MDRPVYDLYDIVELKKEHPCASRSKRWQIIRMGADIKIKCLGCGAVVMLPRFQFEKRMKKVVEHPTSEVKVA